jgi:7,8-dihydroneopterin aldolase/epimerase/oxygenase
MARVGIFEVEKRYVQRIVVSVDLAVTDDYDGVSDRIGDVFDYGDVVSAIRTIVESDHFHLIETLAERIAEASLADVRVISVRITVEKPDILPGCRSVGIAIERRRPSTLI